MSAQMLQTTYALNIHLTASFASRVGVFILTLPLIYYHTTLLLVEALGTAPKSCTTFSPYHQTVLYLYHTE